MLALFAKKNVSPFANSLSNLRQHVEVRTESYPFIHFLLFSKDDRSIYLNLHGHDLRLFWSCLSRFKLSLPQCNVPVVFNGMSGRLSGFPSLY